MPPRAQGTRAQGAAGDAADSGWPGTSAGVSEKGGEGMAKAVAHQRGWQIFEVVFGLPLLAALALQWAVPLAFPRGPLAVGFVLGGAALILMGVMIIVRARRVLAQQGQPTDPGRPTDKLVTTGVYAVSRNPLYLGGVVVLAGVALAFNLPWVLILLFPALVVCHYVLIAPEERYLAAKFGEEYRHYAATVHRWIGRRPMPH